MGAVSLVHAAPVAAVVAGAEAGRGPGRGPAPVTHADRVTHEKPQTEYLYKESNT